MIIGVSGDHHYIFPGDCEVLLHCLVS